MARQPKKHWIVNSAGPVNEALCGWKNVRAAESLEDMKDHGCRLCLKELARLAEEERQKQARIARDHKGRTFDTVLNPPEPVTEYGGAHKAPKEATPAELGVLDPKRWRKLQSECTCGFCSACMARKSKDEAAENRAKPSKPHVTERTLDFHDADQAMHWWADLVEDQLPGRGAMSWASRLHGVEHAKPQEHERPGDHRRWSLALLTVGKGHVSSGHGPRLEAAVRRDRFEQTLRRLYPKGKDWGVGWAACVDILLSRIVGALKDTPLGLRRVPTTATDVGKPFGFSPKRVGALVRHGRAQFMVEYRKLVEERREAGEQWRGVRSA